jgi:hypothetical protein
MMNSGVRRHEGHILDVIISLQRSIRHPSLIQIYANSFLRIAKTFGKPNNLEFKEYMLQCGKSLEAEMEAQTDVLLLPLIKLQRLTGESNETMMLGRNESLTPMSLQRVQNHVKVFRTQLQEWETSLPSGLQNSSMISEHERLPTLILSAMLNVSRHFAKICVHEMDLLNPFVPKNKSFEVDQSGESPVRSSIRVDILFICLEATKEFFDTFLCIPATEYRRLSFVEWSRLIVTTVALYKLSLGSPRIPEWDVQIARNTVRLEIYLEALCYRIQSISIASPSVPEGTDLFSILRQIFDNVRTTYERLRQLPQSVSASDDSKVHETSFPAKPTYQNRCPAFPYWGKSVHQESTTSTSDITSDGTSVADVEVFAEDPFVGADLTSDHDFWSEMMAEAAYGPNWAGTMHL